jgi:hypothetical protein
MPAPKKNPAVVAAIATALKVAKAAKAAKTVSSAAKKPVVKVQPKPNAKTANPNSNVKVKPAAKPRGNPSNDTKAWESVLSSASRGGVGSGSLGKAKDVRVARANKNTALANSAKGKTQTPTAEAAKRRNINR